MKWEKLTEEEEGRLSARILGLLIDWSVYLISLLIKKKVTKD
jgi:hypothetical protein